ncbi:hypothetical protein Pcinc_005323 [Petrolisthes cinctipes]|uniref:Acyl-CoA-binding domain-containing protein 6 n=1 Tax=Petrolisthes cinctipes TaxID=88211 RepID=A0AAE1GF55_PETCI|nr:hypothetical protein Pcinc_005323 [Petrolisthes cinctipes]
MNSFEDIPSSETELEILFDGAALHLQTIAASLPQEKLLHLYARYKQSTEGPCNIPRPGFFDFKGKQKWDAWNGLGSLSKTEAMLQYISSLKELDPNWDENSVSEGPKNSWVRVSTLQQPEGEEVKDEDKNAFDWVKENDVDKLQTLEPEVLEATDENGMNLLHWAADRGHFDITKCLLKHNIDLNSQDNEGQTALHYAASCGHIDVVRILLEHGADKYIQDEDGLQPEECAEDQDVKQLFSS